MKRARVTVSIIIFSLLTFYFLDFADLLPKKLHVIAQWQFLPALLALNIVVLVILVLLTLVFGRVYCSTLCPMGVFQDIAGWVAKKIHGKKKYPAFKENKILRWTIVVITIIAFWSGFSVIVSLLDPYSAYGRIATNMFRPVYLLGNNLIAWIDNHFDDYRFYKTDVFIASMTSLVIALITFLAIGFLSYKYGRLYCNTICPVGTVLGFLSRFSLFKIRIDDNKCNSCSLCSMKCKASCIDSKTKIIDYSRCVNCFDCLETCNRKAMSYNFLPLKKNEKIVSENDAAYNSAKRKFLSALLVAGIAGLQKLFGKNPDTTGIKEIYTSHNVPFKKKHPITPPGSLNIERFNDRCTACQLCVSKCPSLVLKPAFLDYGVIGVMQPTMNFEHGYCNYHCTVCADICPTDALEKITEEEKKTLQIGHVEYIKENCVVVTDGTDCGACSEHCPTQAVSMQPYKNGLRLPVIDQHLCIGCGACEYICPVRPFRAIYVVGNPVHKKAHVPKRKRQGKIEVDDFGF